MQEDYAFARGEAASAIDAAPHKLEGRFSIGGQEHFYLEGQASFAIPGEGDEMTVHASSQDPTETQHIVARVLGVPDAFVTVETRRMGGGFGGKESQACTWAALAALAARVTGRPCKVRLDRDDDFMLTGKRHDFRADWRVGFDESGVVSGYDVMLNARCGCSADLSPGVVDRAMFHAGNGYWLPHVSIASRRLKTNTVSNTAFRGFGGPQGMIAIERVMDAIARERGLDPLDVRKANLLRPGFDRTPYGQAVEDFETQGLMIDELEATSRYRERRAAIAAFNALSPIIKRGIALTPVMFGISFTLIRLNQAGALVHVYSDGSIHLNHGGTEMGQGLFTKVAQIVAEEFGVPLHFVRITATNTSKVPNASPTAASSGTDLNGMAAKIAAAAIRERMAAFAAEQWGVRGRRGRVSRRARLLGQFLDELRRTGQGVPSGAGAALPRRPLQDAGHPLGPRQGARAAFLLLRLWRGLRGGRDRHDDRRNAGSARRSSPRRRRLDQSGARHRPGRGRRSSRGWAG